MAKRIERKPIRVHPNTLKRATDILKADPEEYSSMRMVIDRCVKQIHQSMFPKQYENLQH